MKKAIKVTVEINDVENSEVRNINETKMQFFENIYKIDRPPARVTKTKRRHNSQLNHSNLTNEYKNKDLK